MYYMQQREIRRLKRQFRTWSDGVAPDSPEQVNAYLDAALSSEFDMTLARDALMSWMRDGDPNQQERLHDMLGRVADKMQFRLRNVYSHETMDGFDCDDMAQAFEEWVEGDCFDRLIGQYRRISAMLNYDPTPPETIKITKATAEAALTAMDQFWQLLSVCKCAISLDQGITIDSAKTAIENLRAEVSPKSMAIPT